ncbi:MAG: adenosylcobinamide-GDP ribazoletransferase, partial [Candidatus Methanosuratincola sp.]|nr:adenosylcobinamide-GDP ribazoletransferase [Candidatus Methanosuratincola sp.]
MGLIGGLRSVLSFLTVLPFGSGTIDEMAQYAFFFPAAGALIGAISGGAGLVLFKFLDNSLAGWLTLLVLLLLTGFNHIDGVLDLGDALMFRGSSERRLEILHDR